MSGERLKRGRLRLGKQKEALHTAGCGGLERSTKPPCTQQTDVVRCGWERGKKESTALASHNSLAEERVRKQLPSSPLALFSPLLPSLTRGGVGGWAVPFSHRLPPKKTKRDALPHRHGTKHTRGTAPRQASGRADAPGGGARQRIRRHLHRHRSHPAGTGPAQRPTSSHRRGGPSIRTSQLAELRRPVHPRHPPCLSLSLLLSQFIRFRTETAFWGMQLDR